MREALVFAALLLAVSNSALLPAQATPSIDPDALYDRAIASMENGRYSAAIDDLKELKRHFSTDLIIRSKLVVAYENTGDVQQRDLELADLIKAHSTSNDPKIRSVDAFERDFFHVGLKPVSSVECFDLVGDRPVRYSFLVLAEAGDTSRRRITLGSYERTNRFLRQRGEIKPDERAFHLDEDTASGHITWAMFLREASYGEVKKIIVSILKGEQKPLSQSSVAGPKQAP